MKIRNKLDMTIMAHIDDEGTLNLEPLKSEERDSSKAWMVNRLARE